MNVEAYLTRIGYQGSLEPTLVTLTALHRLHLSVIPYENLDIQLGRTVGLELPAIFDKLVTRRRGGWCFEMNGLFAWALRELGFEVTLLGAAVNRAGKPPKPAPDHLIVQVTLETPYLADVGFGDGLFEPIPLRQGSCSQGALTFALARDGDSWHFDNADTGGAPGFDFTLEPRRLTDFAATSHLLQTSPESGFVRTTVVQRWTGADYAVLRGATLHTGVSERVLGGAEDFAAVLRAEFGLELPEAATLWPRV